MKCCENCFENETIRDRIRDNDEKGDCDFCDSTDVFTIKASELYQAFSGLLSLYEPAEYGEHFHPDMGKEAIDVAEQLPQAIQEEWDDIFNYDKLDSRKQCNLLDAIRHGSGDYDYKDPPTPSSDLWVSKDKSFFHVSEDALWYNFCYHIKHDRRFILKFTGNLDPIADPKDWLPRYLPEVETSILPDTPIFRARLNPREESDAPLGSDKMSAPPKEVARAGRVNPPGISVLYGALEKATAVAEVRPEKDASVTIANILAKRSLRMVDFTTAPYIPDPFSYGEESLSLMISRNAFLRCLNTALSAPVRKDDADIEYVPTQYVAEVIKDGGYDGVLYASSLAPGGKNVVVFDPALLTVNTATELVTVTNVSVTFEERQTWLTRT